MTIRKTTMTKAPVRESLAALLARAKINGVSEEQLREQRASFAYGNAPVGSKITKESARSASQSIKMLATAD